MCIRDRFLDNTACNLASANLMKFFDKKNNVFDVEGFEYVCRLWTTVLEISVLMAQFPSKEVAQLSYEYRTLGLGYANLGTMLMVSGIPYDLSLIHISEPTRLLSISYAVFCLKKKKISS